MKKRKHIVTERRKSSLPPYLVAIDGKRLCEMGFRRLDSDLKYDLQPLPGGLVLRRSYPLESSLFFESSLFCEDICTPDLRAIDGCGRMYASWAERGGRKLSPFEIAALLCGGLGYRISLIWDRLTEPLNIPLYADDDDEDYDEEDSRAFFERLMKELEEEENE